MTSSNKAPPKKPQRRFQFIDNSDIGATGSNSTQVRRHVMQEYMREKRWESRTRAEGEVFDIHTQQPPSPPPAAAAAATVAAPPPPPPPRSQHHPQNLSVPSRKALSRSRNRSRASTAIHKPSQGASNESQDRTVTPQPNSYVLEPSAQAVSSLNEVKYDAIDEVPRSFAPATQLEPKRPRKGFYLTPQSFSLIADMSDVSLPTPTSTISSGDSFSPTSSNSPRFVDPLEGYRSSFTPEPSSKLSAARTDPFDCLPMVLTKSDQELFDFYATVMPACSYGFERRSPKAHNWYLSVFIPEAMKSPVAFQNTILVHAANTQAWVRGLAETSLAIEHRARASKMLSDHFQQYPLDTTDAAISSTLSAAALEDFDPRVERRQYAWMHWNAAVQKIRDRGGPLALEQNKSLRMLINWSDYIFSGYNGLGPTFYFDHRYLQNHRYETSPAATGRQELAQQCEEFIVFLKCAESLASVAANVQHNPTTRKNQPLRYSVFERGQPLYNLLASPNGPRYTKTGQLKQIISRLAALMTINVAIWEYRYSPAASEDFFKELMDNIKYNDLDQHISVEALLQVLLSGSDNPILIHTERPWLVGRLLKVAKRLSRVSWETLNDFLLQCLTLDSFSKPTLETWETTLRAEILSAPLVSYVLPLMQP